MDAQLLAVKMIRRLREVGVLAAIREALMHLRSHESHIDEFDMKHGTDTCGSQRLWRLRISSTNARFGRAYQPTGEEELMEALNYLGVDLQTFTFIDLGCGKGKTLLVASSLGFKQAIGVEFAGELVAIAQENIRKLGINNAAAICGDAADFNFPAGNIVVYLFNPFTQEVMRKVIANLKEVNCRNLYVVYKVASCAELFDGCGFLSRLDLIPVRTSLKIWQGINDNVKYPVALVEKSEGSNRRY